VIFVFPSTQIEHHQYLETLSVIERYV